MLNPIPRLKCLIPSPIINFPISTLIPIQEKSGITLELILRPTLVHHWINFITFPAKARSYYYFAEMYLYNVAKEPFRPIILFALELMMYRPCCTPGDLRGICST